MTELVILGMLLVYVIGVFVLAILNGLLSYRQ